MILSYLVRALVTLVLWRRRFRERRQHPDLPIPTFAHVSCCPNAPYLNRRARLVFPSDVVFAHRKKGVCSQRPHLIHCYSIVIEADLEHAFVGLRNVRVWPCCIDDHATTCVERGDPCTILLIEVVRVCRPDLLHLLL